MQISATHFRILIVAHLMLSLISVLLHFATLSLLPLPLRDYLAADLDAPMTTADMAALSAIAPLFLFALAVWIGLFLFKRWARNLLPLIIIIDALSVTFLGPTVEVGLVTTMSYFAMCVAGIVLTLSFFSPLGERFTRDLRATA